MPFAVEFQRESTIAQQGEITSLMIARRLTAFMLFLLGLCAGVQSAYGLDAVDVGSDAPAINMLEAVEFYRNEGPRLRITTVPGADGLVRGIEVRAVEGDEGTSWIVFALTNTSDQQIDRLLVAPYYKLDGSGLHWPDLGSQRLVNITPSIGFRPEREESNEADVFLFTIDPGATVTFAAEMAG